MQHINKKIRLNKFIYILVFLFITWCPNAKSNTVVHENFIPVITQSITKTHSDLSFSHLTANDGFEGNAVFCSIQDHKGYMWFGTWNGLYKYDGIKLKHTLGPNPVKGEGLYEVIIRVLEDNNHRIWALTRKGLVIWNPMLEQVDTLDSSHLPHHNYTKLVKSICKDEQNNIWIGGEGLLYKYNSEENKIVDFSHVLEGKMKNIYDLYVDKEDQLWVLSLGNHIYRLEKRTEQQDTQSATTNYRLVDDLRFSVFNKGAEVLFQDTEHNYWLFDNSHIQYIRRNNEAPQSWECIKFKNELKSFLRIKDMKVYAFAQRENTIYAATSIGLFTYNLTNKETYMVVSERNKPDKLNANNLYDVYVDKENGLWVATFSGGINYSSPTSNNFNYKSEINNKIHHQVVKAITEDKDQNIWIGTESDGIYFWDRKTDRVNHFHTNSTEGFQPTSNNILSLLTYKDYLFAAPLREGLDIINLKTNEKKTLTEKNTHPDTLSNYIASLAPNDDEHIWAGTWKGLYKVNFKTGNSHHIKQINGKTENIITDKYHNVWASTTNTGLYKYNEKTKTVSLIISYPNPKAPIKKVKALATDDDYLYIGTNYEGLWRYTISTNKLEVLENEELAGKEIVSILVNQEVLWVTTKRGLFSYNRHNGLVKKYNESDGLTSQLFKLNAGVVTSDSIIMVGNMEGLTCFKTSLLKENKTLPKAIITDMYILNKPIEVGNKDQLLKKAISYTSEITLNEGMQYIEFNLASSSYSNLKKNQFQFRLDPYDKEWNTAKHNLAIYTSLPSGQYTFRVRTSNGEGVWSKEECMSILIEPYWWKSTPMLCLYMICIIGLILIILRRYQLKKQKEIKMLYYQKEKEIFQTKMEFFTYMIHEIRTPLTLIVGPLAKIMKKEGTISEVRPDLEVMERNSQRLLTLTNQLMDFRKIEEKSYSIHLACTNLKELVQQTARNFLYINATKEIQVDQVCNSEECWAMIDREAFTKVLTNLLSNAFKFTKDRVRIEITLADDAKMWKIAIEDNGKGIPEEYQESIFNSFYQVQQDVTSDYIGTGVGLFVVKRLLELQNGCIHVTSIPGEGACFIAEVPTADTESFEQTRTTGNEPDSADSADTKEKEESDDSQKILIVEDNNDMRTYIASIFGEFYQTDVCANGVEALEMASGNQYDLIITDLMMPEMDGITLCKTLKSSLITSHIPVVMLTAKADETSQIEGFEAAADAYVIKPFVAEVLVSQVHSILENRKVLRSKFYKEPKINVDTLCTTQIDKTFITKMNKFISSHLSEPSIEVDIMAGEMGMGRTMFYQKVKQVTGLTPNDYIRTYRLKKAVSLLESGETRINEVCYSVGFSSPSYFTKRFIQQFNCSPSDYIKKLNKY